MPVPVHEAAAWRLSDSVALRPEPFGALAYDFAHPQAQLPEDARRWSTSYDASASSTTVGDALSGAGVAERRTGGVPRRPSAPSPTAALIEERSP